jgi:hypothetical protein
MIKIKFKWESLKDFLEPKFFVGRLSSTSRTVYFFFFLFFTVIQTFCALLLEEQIVDEAKYPDDPTNLEQNYEMGNGLRGKMFVKEQEQDST